MYIILCRILSWVCSRYLKHTCQHTAGLANAFPSYRKELETIVLLRVNRVLLELANQNNSISLGPVNGLVDRYNQNFDLTEWKMLYMSLFSHCRHFSKWSTWSQELLAAILQVGCGREIMQSRGRKSCIFGDIIWWWGQTYFATSRRSTYVCQ